MDTKSCLCPPRLECLFPSVLWNLYNQILLALKARFPGDSQAFYQIPSLGSLIVGFRTFTTMGELLWYYCPPVWGSSTQWVWDLIWLWFSPSYHHAAPFFFVFECEVSFFAGFQHPPLSDCSTASYYFGVLSETDEHCPSTPASWTKTQDCFLILYISVTLMGANPVGFLRYLIWRIVSPNQIPKVRILKAGAPHMDPNPSFSF